MPYRCKTCGSLQVYHHCVVLHPLAAASPANENVVTPPLPPPPPPSTQLSPPITNVVVDVAKPEPLPFSPLCDNQCGCEVEKTLRGLRRKNGMTVRVDGDSLCMPCYEQLKDVVEEHIPCPPGWPAGYYVARLHGHKKVSPAVAITLLWCRGWLIKAARLKSKGRVRKVEVSSLCL